MTDVMHFNPSQTLMESLSLLRHLRAIFSYCSEGLDLPEGSKPNEFFGKIHKYVSSVLVAGKLVLQIFLTESRFRDRPCTEAPDLTQGQRKTSSSSQTRRYDLLVRCPTLFHCHSDCQGIT